MNLRMEGVPHISNDVQKSPASVAGVSFKIDLNDLGLSVVKCFEL